MGIEYYEEHLEDVLDANGDVMPPWAKFPTIARYSIGWRMGAGEGWMAFFHVFQRDRLGTSVDARKAFLRRHPPAPHTWANWVLHLLERDKLAPQREVTQRQLDELTAEGLIAEDAPYRRYVEQDAPDVVWQTYATPAEAARYPLRPLWFWTRRNREQGPLPMDEALAEKAAWATFLAVARRERAPTFDAERGLESLAVALAAGQPPAPWTLGLPVESVRGSMELDMGYADAFQMWLFMAFDDRPTLKAYVASQPPPPASWATWLQGEVFLPGDLPVV
ncbi:MAG: hypothetical protein AAGH15_22720 [Myxococcota bacterium]